MVPHPRDKSSNLPQSAAGDGWLAWWQARRVNAGTWFLGILVTLIGAWALRQTVWISLPLVFAFFIALAIWPVCSWTQTHVPQRLHWLGYASAMLMLVAVLAVFCAAIWFAAQTIVGEATKQAFSLQQFWDQINHWAQQHGLPAPGGILQGVTGGAGNAPSDGGGETSQDGRNPITGFALSLVNSAWHILAALVLIFFLVLLMLIEAPTWRAKLAHALGERQEQVWLESIAAIAERFRWYLVVRTALGLLTGLLYGLWLWLFGVELAVLWGLLAFFLNYVPTLGSLVAGVLPALFAIVQKDLTMGLIVAGGLLTIEQVMGNYVDPRLQGRQLAISPVVLLIGLLVWSWIWGVAGALLAAPMMVLITIALTHIPALKPVALFMSNTRDMIDLEQSVQPNRSAR